MPLAFAGSRPARARLDLKPHRRTLSRAMPIGTEPQGSSPWPAISVGDRLLLPELGQPNRLSHNRQRHYPHSAQHHPREPFPRFPPLRLLRPLPPECAAPSMSGRRPRTLNRTGLPPAYRLLAVSLRDLPDELRPGHVDGAVDEPR